MKIGVQLYTVREACHDDFTGTLAALARLGVRGVEFAGEVGGMPPAALADFLTLQKLVCCGYHAALDALADPNSRDYQYARALRTPYVTSGCQDVMAADPAQAIELCLPAARTAQALGLAFTYHNHAGEFARGADGSYALDRFYADTPRDLVLAELDTYWVAKGGGDPVAYLHTYAGRVPQLHLKDMDPTDGSFAPVGEGCLPMPAIIEAAAATGVTWLIIEQDVCKDDPLDCIRRSITNVREMLAATVTA